MKTERAWFFAACFGLAAVHFIGCDGDPPASTATSSSSSSGGDAGFGGSGGGSGGSGGSGGASSSSSSSSSGLPPECTTAADCPNNGPVNFCGEPDCYNGKCRRKGLQSPGTALPGQLYGDCLERQCNIEFDIGEVPDDKDVYDDAKECTEDICTNGVMSNVPIKQGTLCTQPGVGQGVCDGNGACVTCLSGVQGCTGTFVCTMNVCVGIKCTNGKKDPGEGDIDCGASDCLPCADGKTCVNSGHCASSVCTAGTCTAPSCTDTFKNGKETGYDCGGPDCNKCVDNDGCATPSDCQSGVCQAGVCIPPTCTDAVQNGDEGGIDCGGSCPSACP